eukprot:5898599-Prymnesium_polylepis.1
MRTRTIVGSHDHHRHALAFGPHLLPRLPSHRGAGRVPRPHMAGGTVHDAVAGVRRRAYTRAAAAAAAAIGQCGAEGCVAPRAI